MGISFTTPEALLFLVPAIGLTLLLSAAARHRLSRGRRRLAIALRVLLIALLVGALAGL